MMLNEMTKVYIAAPYTKGDVALNVREVIKVAEELMAKGYIPYVPHLSHLWHLMSPHNYPYWAKIDDAFLSACDVLLRLPGESDGADKEVELAQKLGIPACYSIEEVEQRFE